MAEGWRHEASLEWLDARRSVLTASEIVKLQPALRKYRKEVAADPAYLPPAFVAMWARKNTELAVDMGDSVSWSWAARGHIMEPYAVKDFNSALGAPFMYHWDDCVVKNGVIGFSPDALDVPQPPNGEPECSVGMGGLQFEDGVVPLPVEGMEIKSYEPGHHMECVIRPRMQAEELMQLAVAMHVLPSLKVMHLVFYCPGAPVPMWVNSYSRKDLAAQIRLVEETRDVYVNTAMQVAAKFKPTFETSVTDADVYAEWIKQEREVL